MMKVNCSMLIYKNSSWHFSSSFLQHKLPLCESKQIENLYCCRETDLFGSTEWSDDGSHRVSPAISVLFPGSLVEELVSRRSGDLKGPLIVRKGLKESPNIIDNIEKWSISHGIDFTCLIHVYQIFYNYWQLYDLYKRSN